MNIWTKVSIDCILLACVTLPILFFYLFGKPFQRGFFCQDESIRYPYKDSTVTSLALYAFGTLIPVSFILIIEYFDHVYFGRSRTKKEKVEKWLKSLYMYIGIFLFGCGVSHFSVDICKYSVGRLRPHFITVCKPNWDRINCNDDNGYINDDVCNPSNADEADLIREARLSFISGHASFSTYTMFFLIFYLQYRFQIRGFSLLRPVLQFGSFSVALFTSLSRISDYKHHPFDVLAGAANGFSFASVTFFCFGAHLFGKFRTSSISSQDIELEDSAKNQHC